MRHTVKIKQPNSKMCFVCGLKNVAGLHSFFYELDNDELLAIFKPEEAHQGYPGRLHGGIATAILDETMRLYPPVPILCRQALQDDEIRGKKIPAGSLMLVVPWLVQRHKKFWKNPDHFIPERFLPAAEKPRKFTYLPFSAGPRVCIGKSFGITESVLAIAIVAQRFCLSLPPNTDVKHECRLTLRPKGKLLMIMHKR